MEQKTSGRAVLNKTAKVSVVLLGPAQGAVSGVSTHLNQLLSSRLKDSFCFLHFQVGSEGRTAESKPQAILRLLFGPFSFAIFLGRNLPDIVHINTSMMPKSYWRDLGFLAVARVFRRKVVYQVHGGVLPHELFGNNKLLTALLRRALKSADAVVLLAQRELHAYRAFDPSIRLEVLPNGILPQPFPPDLPLTRYSDPLRLTYLGRLNRDKGLFEVLEALAIMTREGRNMHLTVAGSGKEEGRIRERAAELNLCGRVQFVGPVSGAIKDRLWAGADIFVFPTYHEGMPYALLEAMAAGVVPVTTSVGAIPDIVTDGVDGLLVEIGSAEAVADALRRLDEDRPLLARMAAAGRVRILEKYTVSHLADNFGGLYTSLIKANEECAA